jgi:hypothetical protein
VTPNRLFLFPPLIPHIHNYMKATSVLLNQVLEAEHGDTPITLRALLPSQLIGCCIGVGGSTHRDLERQFGTNIYFGSESARGTRLASVAGATQRVARTWRECAFIMFRKRGSADEKVFERNTLRSWPTL